MDEYGWDFDDLDSYVTSAKKSTPSRTKPKKKKITKTNNKNNIEKKTKPKKKDKTTIVQSPKNKNNISSVKNKNKNNIIKGRSKRKSIQKKKKTRNNEPNIEKKKYRKNKEEVIEEEEDILDDGFEIISNDEVIEATLNEDRFSVKRNFKKFMRWKRKHEDEDDIEKNNSMKVGEGVLEEGGGEGKFKGILEGLCVNQIRKLTVNPLFLKKDDENGEKIYVEDEKDEDWNEMIEERSLNELNGYFDFEIREKLRLLSEYEQFGCNDYSLIIIILSFLKGRLNRNYFYEILKRKKKVRKVYIRYLEEQLKSFVNMNHNYKSHNNNNNFFRYYYDELKDLFHYLRNQEELFYLQLKYSLINQKFKEQLYKKDVKIENEKKNIKYNPNHPDIQKRYDSDMKKFAKCLDLINDIQTDNVFSESTYGSEGTKGDNETEEKESSGGIVSRLKSRLHLGKGDNKIFQNEQLEITQYLSLIDREKQIEIIDRNLEIEVLNEKEEDEGENNDEVNEKVRNRRRERKKEKYYFDYMIKNKNEKIKRRKKQMVNLFKVYPRYNIYGLNASDFMKYMLTYHSRDLGIVHTDSNLQILSIKENTRELNISRKRYCFLAVYTRSKLHDWRKDIWENILFPARKPVRSPVHLKSLFAWSSSENEKDIILPIEAILKVVSKNNPPITIMEFILNTAVKDDLERYSLAKDFQCFECAIRSCLQLKDKLDRDIKLEELLHHINRVLGKEEMKMWEDRIEYLKEEAKKGKGGIIKGWINKYKGIKRSLKESVTSGTGFDDDSDDDNHLDDKDIFDADDDDILNGI